MKNFRRRLRILEVYAAVSGVIFLVMALAAFVRSPTQKLEELDVERLNVVERNGNLRLVIANSDHMPDPIIDGKSFKTERPSGIIFYNRKGDEDGGLIFDGIAKEGDKYGAYGGLSFDQYRQSQIVAVTYNDHTGSREAGLHVWDRPETPLSELLARDEAVAKMPEGSEKTSAEKALQSAKFSPARVFVGKNQEKDSQVTLYDAKGKARIDIVVTAAGDAHLDFLDEEGKITYSLPNRNSISK